MPIEIGAVADLLSWILLVAGFALVAASWMGRAPKRLGWAGLWLALAGAASAWLAPPGAQWAVLAIGLVVAALQWKPARRGGGAVTRRRGRAFRPWDQEAELRRLCHGDEKLVERLIEHERQRNPKLSRAGAALAATTRLKHDKR